jgi:teichuronic acid exporter
MTHNSQPVASALMSSASLKIISQIISWGVTIYALRSLSPADYGVVAIVSALMGLLLPFADNPLIYSLVRKRVLSEIFLDKFKAYVLTVSVLASVGIFVSAYIYSLCFNNWIVFQVALISAVTCLIFGLKVIPESLLLREKRVTQRAVGVFIEAICSSLALLLLVHFKFGVYSLVIAPLLGLTFRTLYYNHLAPIRIQSQIFSLARFRRLFKWTAWSSAIEFVLFLGGNAPIILASFVLSATHLGVFSTSLYLVMVLVGKIMQVINPITVSQVSRATTNSSDAASRITTGVGFIGLLGAPAFVGLSSLAPDIVDIVLGPKWHEASPIVALVALAMPLRLIFEFLATALRARGLDKYLFNLQLLNLIPVCAGILIGGLYGLLEVAIGFFVAYTLFAFVGCVFAALTLQLSFSRVLKNMMIPFIGTLVMFIGLHLAKPILLEFSTLQRLGLDILIGALLYVPAAAFGYLSLMKQVKAQESTKQAPINVPAYVTKYGSAKKNNKATLSVFTFHRILEQADSMESESPTAKEFEVIIKTLAKHVRFVSLDEGIAAIENNASNEDLASITFDDGYRDNLTVALPVLKDLKVPATLFASTAHLTGQAFFVDIIVQTVRAAVPNSIDASMFGLGKLESKNMKKAKNTAETILAKLKYYHPSERDKLAFDFWCLHGSPPLPRLLLDESELKQCSDEGFTIGAHTHSHTILTSATNDFIAQDIEQNCNVISSITGIRPKYFAYPNGKPSIDFTSAQMQTVASFKFRAAFTSASGICQPGVNSILLPRLSIKATPAYISALKHKSYIIQSRFSTES